LVDYDGSGDISLLHLDACDCLNFIFVLGFEYGPILFPKSSLWHLDSNRHHDRFCHSSLDWFGHDLTLLYGFGDIAGLRSQLFLLLDDCDFAGDFHRLDDLRLYHEGHFFPDGFLDAAALVFRVHVAVLVPVDFVSVAGKWCFELGV